MAPHVKFLRGTRSAYDNLQLKDEDTLYFVAEEDAPSGVLYLGSKMMCGSGDEFSLEDLTDVFFSGSLKGKSFLVYEEDKWVNKSSLDIVTSILPTFTGATSTTPGVPGLVPAPTSEDTGKFLCSDGTWITAVGTIPQETLDKINQLAIDVEGLEETVAGLSSTILEKRVGDLETEMSALEGAVSVLTEQCTSIDEKLKWQDISVE